MDEQARAPGPDQGASSDAPDADAANAGADELPEEHIMNKDEMRAHAEEEAQAAPAAPPPPPPAAPTLSPDHEPPREMADFLKPPVVTRDVVDEASQQSFPASDPPGYTSASASPEKPADVAE